jgi:hypothetical protein
MQHDRDVVPGAVLCTGCIARVHGWGAGCRMLTALSPDYARMQGGHAGCWWQLIPWRLASLECVYEALFDCLESHTEGPLPLMDPLVGMPWVSL